MTKKVKDNCKNICIKPHKNEEVKIVLFLFNNLKHNQFCSCCKIVRINDALYDISENKLKDDFLIFISYNKPQDAKDYYKERWQIKMCIKALKSIRIKFHG